MKLCPACGQYHFPISTYRRWVATYAKAAKSPAFTEQYERWKKIVEEHG